MLAGDGQYLVRGEGEDDPGEVAGALVRPLEGARGGLWRGLDPLWIGHRLATALRARSGHGLDHLRARHGGGRKSRALGLIEKPLHRVAVPVPPQAGLVADEKRVRVKDDDGGRFRLPSCGVVNKGGHGVASHSYCVVDTRPSQVALRRASFVLTAGLP
jgi:hypothetical protein